MSFAFRAFIQVTSLALTLEAALFLAKGNLGLPSANISQIAATRWGYNPDLVESLVQQNADTWVGVGLLLLAFSLQMWNALWSVRIGDLGVYIGGALSALVFSIALGIGAFYLSEHVASSTAENVKAMLIARGIAG